MKKIVVVMALVFAILMSFSVFALADEMAPKSIDTVLGEIRQELGISSSDPIDADKVSAAKLEELGDSVMEAMIGNSAMHEHMDDRLGGDGSASLTAFHKNLGYNYLSGNPINMMGWMHGGMMGFNRRGNFNMMGFGWLALIIGIAATAGIIVFILSFMRHPMNNPGNYNSNKNRALEILSERYAKGEIGDEEYRQRKSELTRP